MQPPDGGAAGVDFAGGVLAGNGIKMFWCGRCHSNGFPELKGDASIPLYPKSKERVVRLFFRHRRQRAVVPISDAACFFQLTIFAFDADDGDLIRMIASQQIRTTAAKPASHNPRIKLAGL
jgi:hypothetical protein